MWHSRPTYIYCTCTTKQPKRTCQGKIKSPSKRHYVTHSGTKPPIPKENVIMEHLLLLVGPQKEKKKVSLVQSPYGVVTRVWHHHHHVARRRDPQGILDVRGDKEVNGKRSLIRPVNMQVIGKAQMRKKLAGPGFGKNTRRYR
jgi:hypothetical protein